MKDLQFLIELGRRIKKIRVEKNITQYQLAIDCEFEKASMSRIESGQINITILTLLKIGNALGVGIADLVERRKEPGVQNIPDTKGLHGKLLKIEILKYQANGDGHASKLDNKGMVQK